jgi:hypothetical protein
MAKGGKKNAAAANQVKGNLTVAMNQLAAANSYVLFLSIHCCLEADYVLALARRSSKGDKAAQKQLNNAMQMMASMMAAGNAAVNCAGA